MLSAMGQYSADKAQAKAQKAIQKYKNKMARIADAINQNALTTNTTLAIQQSAQQAVYQRKDELSSLGSTAVAAAAAGVRGKSVTASLLDVKRGAALIEKQRSDDLQHTFMQIDQQRLGSALSAVQNQDLSYIPKPSFGTYLVGALAQSEKQVMSFMGFGG